MSSTHLEHLRYRRLRAPREEGGALIEPPVDALGEVLAANVQARSGRCYDLQGRCLSAVAHDARRDLLDGALRWTTAYRDVAATADAAQRPIFLAGHQPELFHPGVWIKNFMLARMAERHDAVAVNLIVDTDVMKRNALLVPTGTAADPHLVSVPLDRAGLGVPFEERPIQDGPLFAGFGRRAAEVIGPLISDPLVREYWPLVTGRMRATENLGACLAQSRHMLEGRWGAETLEIPESWVCRSEAFGWFAAHVLAHLPRFRDAYNRVMADYRRLNRIRSRSHPAPDLAADGEWLEAPFWIWSVDNPRRRRVFARQRGDEIEVTDRHGRRFRLDLSADADGSTAVEQLGEIAQRGFKIRTRALVTTLWARLALGDLFLHGIGGAKYDQVTDALIATFFGMEPPRYMVASGTFRLPVAREAVTGEDVRAIDQRLRELTWHPELYVDLPAVARGDDAGPAELVERKQRWISTAPTPENARQRFLEIRRASEALQPWVASERRRLMEERARLAAAARAGRVLGSREFAFCLFPAPALRAAFAAILPPRAG